MTLIPPSVSPPSADTTESPPTLPALFEVNYETGAQYWSPELAALAGLSDVPHVDFGRLWRVVHPNDRRATFRAILNSLRPGGSGLFSQEFRIVRPDGEERRLRASGRTLFQGDVPGRRPTRMLGTVCDVTISCETAGAFDRNPTYDELLGALGHELRNPLAAIRCATEALRTRGNEADSVRWVEDVVARHSARLERLADDLLYVSEVRHGGLKLQKEIVAFRTLMERAVQEVRPEIAQRGQILTAAPLPEDWWIEGDPARLKNALIHLLGNASRFTGWGGRVVATAIRQGSEVVLRVDDSGVGISRERLGRIFEPFVRSSAGRSRKDGLGVGLALTRAIIEAHGGKLTAHSEGVGQGARMQVTLPLASGRRRSLGVVLSLFRANAVRPRKRIFIADDNADFCLGLQKVLAADGHEVAVGFNGRAALSMAPPFRPDAILLALGLPDMDGSEVVRGLRAAGCESLLVAMTGHAADGDRREAIVEGFDAFLTKPLDLELLRSILAGGVVQPQGSMG